MVSSTKKHCFFLIYFNITVPASSDSQPYLIAFFSINNFLGLGCFVAVSFIFRKKFAIDERERVKAAKGFDNINDEDDDEHKETIFDDMKVFNGMFKLS